MQIHSGAMLGTAKGGRQSGDRARFEVTKRGNEGFRKKGI